MRIPSANDKAEIGQRQWQWKCQRAIGGLGLGFLAVVVRREVFGFEKWELSIGQSVTRANGRGAHLTSPHLTRFDLWMLRGFATTPHFATHLRSFQRHLTPLAHETSRLATFDQLNFRAQVSRTDALLRIHIHTIGRVRIHSPGRLY